jgi:hypothetical protein
LTSMPQVFIGRTWSVVFLYLTEFLAGGCSFTQSCSVF